MEKNSRKHDEKNLPASIEEFECIVEKEIHLLVGNNEAIHEREVEPPWIDLILWDQIYGNIMLSTLDSHGVLKRGNFMHEIFDNHGKPK